jgi:AbiU2
MQKTDEQVLAGYKEAMGQDLGELFHALSNELTWLHWHWAEFRTLFGKKPSRIDLMNESAPFFFRVVHDTLFESTLLGIARLVAPPKSAGKPNLTIQRFLPVQSQETTEIPLIGNRGLQAEINVLVQNAIAVAGFAVDWRNRHIAHRDLELSLKKSLEPLSEATREKVVEALSALREVLNFVEVSYCESTTAYDFVISTWGAETLLTIIRDGLLREKEIRERWNRGEFQQDNTEPI